MQYFESEELVSRTVATTAVGSFVTCKLNLPGGLLRFVLRVVMQDDRKLMEVTVLQMTHPAYKLATSCIDPPDLKLRKETVHVNMSVVFQLGHKLSC